MPRENAIARIAECGPQPYAAPPSSLGGPLGERCAVREDPAANRANGRFTNTALVRPAHATRLAEGRLLGYVPRNDFPLSDEGLTPSSADRRADPIRVPSEGYRNRGPIPSDIGCHHHQSVWR